MSSGFVSGGTTDQPIERDDEWLKAQQEIEAKRRMKEEESRQEGGKTLYEVLQSNKAAKQDAFEESIRLKNQFRNLDEDEVEFLDSVLESTRKKEEQIKKQTSEQLDLFRRQQEEADRAFIEGNTGDKAEENSPTGDVEEKWTVNRGKRKRVEDKKALQGFKLRKSSTSTQDDRTIDPRTTNTSLLPLANPPSESHPKARASASPDASPPRPVGDTKNSANAATNTATSSSSKLGLAGYSSDEED